METQAAAHRAKRRKRDAAKSAEQEGAKKLRSTESADVPHSSPAGAGGDEPYVQDPLPGVAGGEEEEGVDRISSLPDAILGEVISLLPTKEAARTRILATRWRHLWCSAPLNLDAGDLRTIDDISLILSAHRGPGRRFRFDAQHLWSSPATLDAWLRSPALDNLQEIECWARLWGGEVLQPPPPPASTFRFSSSLCVASFSECHLSEDITQTLQFPRLKKLALQLVSISEDSLHSIIAASPVLECLMLCEVFGLRCVRINSASITSIGVCAPCHHNMTFFEEFIVEDAPCLRRILYLRPSRCGRMRLSVSVISAPNLEALGCLSHGDESSRLTLGSTIIEPCRMNSTFRVINSTTPVFTVKILAVNFLYLSLDVIIDLMRCFPCLEKLYIQTYMVRDKNLWRRKHRNLIKCLDIRLKTVVLNTNYYRGTMPIVNFATFFVLNAKMLESMTFESPSLLYVTDRFLAEQHHLLQLEKRASRCARFYFTSKRCRHNFSHINHVHDLSKTDPFECKETGAGVCASFE